MHALAAVNLIYQNMVTALRIFETFYERLTPHRMFCAGTVDTVRTNFDMLFTVVSDFRYFSGIHGSARIDKYERPLDVKNKSQ